MNISIIGKVSVGKSSFINSFHSILFENAVGRFLARLTDGMYWSVSYIGTSDLFDKDMFLGSMGDKSYDLYMRDELIKREIKSSGVLEFYIKKHYSAYLNSNDEIFLENTEDIPEDVNLIKYLKLEIEKRGIKPELIKNPLLRPQNDMRYCSGHGLCLEKNMHCFFHCVPIKCPGCGNLNPSYVYARNGFCC
jgi:GTPase SAR1 family protein